MTAEAAIELGLTNPRGLGLSRVPVRLREEAVTLSAWRLSVASDEGDGFVTLIEAPGREAMYRGDGVCLGWAQERMASAYDSLRPKEEASTATEFPQLG